MCPHCGHPIARDGERITTQQTSQRIKALQALAVLLIALGLIGLYFDSVFGIPAAAVGIVLYLAARLAGWWRHG